MSHFGEQIPLLKEQDGTWSSAQAVTSDEELTKFIQLVLDTTDLEARTRLVLTPLSDPGQPHRRGLPSICCRQEPLSCSAEPEMAHSVRRPAHLWNDVSS